MIKLKVIVLTKNEQIEKNWRSDPSDGLRPLKKIKIKNLNEFVLSFGAGKHQEQLLRNAKKNGSKVIAVIRKK